jgi:hypothetical protein
MVVDDGGVSCKCGIELRTYVPGLYGGYFYTNSREEGLKRLKQVRELVIMQISPKVPVVLKRYCTEYERDLGDSAKYVMPEHAKDVEKFYMAHIAESEAYKQPKLAKLEVYQGWMDFGWKFGTDEDRKEIEDTYNNGKPLYPKPRTYEE